MTSPEPDHNQRPDPELPELYRSGVTPRGVRVTRVDFAPTEFGLLNPTVQEALDFCAELGVALEPSLASHLCACAAANRRLELGELLVDERAAHELSIREECYIEVGGQGSVELFNFCLSPFADWRQVECDVFVPESGTDGPVVRFAHEPDHGGFSVGLSWDYCRQILDADAAAQRWRLLDRVLLETGSRTSVPFNFTEFFTSLPNPNAIGAEMLIGRHVLRVSAIVPGVWGDDGGELGDRIREDAEREHYESDNLGEDVRVENPDGERLARLCGLTGIKASPCLLEHLLDVTRGIVPLDSRVCEGLRCNGREIKVIAYRSFVREGDEFDFITSVAVTDEFGPFGHTDLTLSPLFIHEQGLVDNFRGMFHWYGQPDEIARLPWSDIRAVAKSR